MNDHEIITCATPQQGAETGSEWVHLAGIEGDSDHSTRFADLNPGRLDPHTAWLPIHSAESVLPHWLMLYLSPEPLSEGVIVHRMIFEQCPPNSVSTSSTWAYALQLAHEGITFGEISIGNISSASGVDQNTRGWQKPPLVPRKPAIDRQWIKSFLDGFQPERFKMKIRSAVDLEALRAGLYQVHGYLDESHSHSQEIEGEGTHRAGDYWHAIMHRREPDYSNAKYWFRRVGNHPIYPELSRIAQSLIDQDLSQRNRQRSQELERLAESITGGRWDAFAFVDFCEHAEGQGHDEDRSLAESIQWNEMLLLMQSTFEDAFQT